MRSKQTSIRFNKEKLDLIKKKEKLTTDQKVVDFLVDAYYWKNKLFVAPQLNGLGQTLPYVAPQVPQTPIERYTEEITKAASHKHLEVIMKQAEKDTALIRGEKDGLKVLADKRADEIDF